MRGCITYTKSGQMRPTLPPKIAKALAHLRAMTEPYFDSATADEAECALRVAIREKIDTKRPSNQTTL